METTRHRSCCFYRLGSYLKKNTFRKETYFMMNHYSLRIKDPEIREDFENNRMQNFDRLFAPMLLVVVVLQIAKLASWYYNSTFAGNGQVGSLVQAAVFLVWMFIWAILRVRWKKLTTLVVFLPPIAVSTIINL